MVASEAQTLPLCCADPSLFLFHFSSFCLFFLFHLIIICFIFNFHIFLTLANGLFHGSWLYFLTLWNFLALSFAITSLHSSFVSVFFNYIIIRVDVVMINSLFSFVFFYFLFLFLIHLVIRHFFYFDLFTSPQLEFYFQLNKAKQEWTNKKIWTIRNIHPQLAAF